MTILTPEQETARDVEFSAWVREYLNSLTWTYSSDETKTIVAGNIGAFASFVKNNPDKWPALLVDAAATHHASHIAALTQQRDDEQANAACLQRQLDQLSRFKDKLLMQLTAARAEAERLRGELAAKHTHGSHQIPTEQENPQGLYRRYVVTKANGEPCDPRAVYFVLRLDGDGDDKDHIRACRSAAKCYASNVHDSFYLRRVGGELLELVDRLEEADKLADPKAPADWPEDSAHENGNYQCQCSTCGCMFIGHKRRVVCKACAAKAPADIEEFSDAIQRIITEAESLAKDCPPSPHACPACEILHVAKAAHAVALAALLAREGE